MLKRNYPTSQEYSILIAEWKDSEGVKKERLASKVLTGMEMWIRFHVSKQYPGIQGDDLETLRQSGRIGVLKAMIKWDPDVAKKKGNSFATHAWWWLRSETSRSRHSELGGVVKTPTPKRLIALREIRNNPDKERTLESREVLPIYMSFSWVPGTENEDSEFSSDSSLSRQYVRWGAFSSEEAYDKAVLSERTTILRKAMETLDKRERIILTKRSEEETLKEIGKIFGITRERVRQIERGALKKVKEAYINVESGRRMEYKTRKRLRQFKRRFKSVVSQEHRINA